MRPISVRFKCFGPYVDEQFVDFTKLEPSGLFLICGETGSGKTTILDAMCYALYGKSSGGLRGDITVMRCKQAAPADETFVEFIFESGGKRYRFFRSIKPKKKRKAKEDADEGADKKKQPVLTDYNTTCECQVLENDVFVPLPDSKDKKNYLNDKSEELIGLTYDQFRQVIILPQGQFEKLLVSNSEEKESILVTLFHAERWHELAVKMYEIADAAGKELDREKMLIIEKLKSYECQSPAELMDKALAAAQTLTALRQELETAEKLVEEQKKKNEAALLDNQVFEQRDKLREALDGLVKQIDSFHQESIALARSDRADEITPIYNEYQTALTKKNECEGSQSKADEALKDAQAGLETVLKVQQTHEARRSGYEQGKQRVILLENARELYQTLAEKKAAADAAGEQLTAVENQAKNTAETFQTRNTDWEKAIMAQKQAIYRQQEAQRQYLLGIGGTLAQRLVDGEACPVCGSLSHPAPAQPAEGHITDAQLDDLTKAMEQANRQEELARKRRIEAESKNNEAQNLLAQQRQQTAVAKSEYDRAMEQRIDGIEDGQQLDKELLKYAKAIADYEKEDTVMQEKVNTAKSNLQAAQTSADTARVALQTASGAFAVQKQKWEEVRNAAGFESDEQYSSACIDVAQKLARQTMLIQFKTDYANARKAYDDKLKELEGREQPDIRAIKTQLKAAEDKRDSIRSQLVLAAQKQTAMQQDAEMLAERSRKYEKKRAEAEESMVFAKRLRGDYGISLQRYVLGVMLTSITIAANRLLKTVYAGRYQLYRTNESAGSSRKRGLELEVYDANNNERRSVTTLSGGEKFLVALSLAIGLSTVVQAQGSGVRLEAMFIDEGFGSLDRESVNDALEVLQGIRRSSGIVGIISHVEQLAETIPAKIQITKTRNGSKCEIHC